MFGPSLLKERMPLTDGDYVPALRWRRGEYQALLRLGSHVKDRIVPLITIPPIEFDFDTRTPKKTVHEHVEPFVRRYKEKWGPRPAWLALDDSIARGRMNNGAHVFDYVLDGLRAHCALAIPVLSLDTDAETKAAVVRAGALDRHGAGVNLRLEDLMRDDVGARATRLAADIGEPLERVDLLVDLAGPNYQPYDAFANALVPALERLGDTQAFRNFVLLGTAIPESFGPLAKGTDELPRHDWLFYKFLLERLPTAMRRPIYGDHTIVHPSFTAAIDFRTIKPPSKIVYTTDSTWAVRKGGAFQSDPDQMHEHCSVITRDPRFGFRGATFSSGDDYIEKCADGAETPSNLTRWKEVGVSHHITMVVHDVANLPDGSSTP